jgi:hypothetical protein
MITVTLPKGMRSQNCSSALAIAPAVVGQKNIDWQVGWFVLAAGGFSAYALFLNHHIGNPLGMFKAYQTSTIWAYIQFTPNIFKTAYVEAHMLASLVIHQPATWQLNFVNGLVPFGSWLFFLIITLLAVGRLRFSYLFLLLASLAVFAANGNFVSANRYVLPLFPTYLILAGWCKGQERIFGFIVAASAMAMGVFLFLFANGIWVA